MVFSIFAGSVLLIAAIVCVTEVVGGSSGLTKWLDARIAESEGERRKAFEEVKEVVSKKPWRK